ncbi:MAG TPA: NADH-quinone oxidoreductase subunit NuoB [Nitrososphaerales archaeon]|nr:NADH-quinone oxidoreductase subunit NuoB [Nitrososphaerales archaeon]
MKKTEPRHGILGDHVETDRRVLDRARSSPGFRADVAFKPDAEPLDSELCRRVEEICAPKAITSTKADGSLGLVIDKGRCIMCGLCEEAAPTVFELKSEFARPVKRRSDLVVARPSEIVPDGRGSSHEELGRQLSEKITKILGRSLAIREVDAGSCNGCEVEVAALNNAIYDIERFGVHFVASPRHADVLLVTGVGSRNMEAALRRTYDATPDPKVVVAAGACASSGGIFGDTYASSGGIGNIVPVDVYVPGCPPRPEALLYGLLLAVDRIR